LLAADVELDYDAVMSSKEMLRVWEQTDWPVDDFTLADNLEDLERHEREHREGIAFTYTVLNPAETECLGCIYIVPLQVLLSRFASSPDGSATINSSEACTSFWVRVSRLDDGLEDRLLDALIGWFKDEWAFSRVVFSTNSEDNRQAKLFAERGLRQLYAFDYPDRDVQFLIYG
jgi:hypothetical protein